MAYLSRDVLENMGFAKLGLHVKISDKTSIYEPDKMEIGDHSRIDDFCVLSGRIIIGRNVHIAPMCLVAGGKPGITLEDFAGLAYHVKVFAQSDDYSGETMTNPTVPAEYKAETFNPVHVGRHSIVGAGAVITPGVSLGEGTAIGALALVLRSTDSWSIYAGIPARRAKGRSKNLLQLERQYLDIQSN